MLRFMNRFFFPLSGCCILICNDVNAVGIYTCTYKCAILVYSTVHGRNPAPVEVASLSHYLQVFFHPRCLFGISSNRMHIIYI